MSQTFLHFYTQVSNDWAKLFRLATVFSLVILPITSPQFQLKNLISCCFFCIFSRKEAQYCRGYISVFLFPYYFTIVIIILLIVYLGVSQKEFFSLPVLPHYTSMGIFYEFKFIIMPLIYYYKLYCLNCSGGITSYHTQTHTHVQKLGFFEQILSFDLASGSFSSVVLNLVIRFPFKVSIRR